MREIILITGAAGMVGSNLIKRIKFKNKVVIAIDNLTLGKKKFLLPYIKKKNFFFLKKNLSKKIISKKFENILKNNYLSEVWLLAANSDIKKGSSNYKVDFNNTYLSTINIVKFLKKYIKDKTKIIFTSSSAIYGETNSTISEKTKIKKPISNYGIMKLKSEIFLTNFSKQFKIKTFIFRFPNVVGSNLTHGLLFDMRNKIFSKNKYIQVLGNGEQQKPYSHVNEIIDCMYFFKKKKFKRRINFFNIGSNDDGVKVKDIVRKIKKKLKSQKTIKFQKQKVGWKGDVVKYKYSTKKINNLGFKFKLNSQQAIDKTINNIK